MSHATFLGGGEWFLFCTARGVMIEGSFRVKVRVIRFFGEGGVCCLETGVFLSDLFHAY